MKYQYKDFFDYIELLDEIELGNGQGRNRVLAARDTLTGKKLAIKEVVVPRHASNKLREVTLREVQNMIVLGAECKYIVPLLDYKECKWENERGEGSNLLLVMPQYEKTLDTEMTDRYKKYEETGDINEWYDPLTICTIGINICKALEFAHTRQLPDYNGTIQKGVVHRDIKPENIFWDNVLKTYILGDFGSSKFFDGKTTRTRASGTSGFCAPEQNYDDRECGPWTDIYSLGIILYLLGNGGFFPFARKDEPLVAESPFDEDGGYLKRYSDRETDRCPLPKPCLLDDELSCIILKACAFDKDDRYQTAKEFMEDLEKAQINLLRGQVNIADTDRSLFGGVQKKEEKENPVAAEMEFLKNSLLKMNEKVPENVDLNEKSAKKEKAAGKEKIEKVEKTEKRDKPERAEKGFPKSAILMGLAFVMIALMFLKNFMPYFVGSHAAPTVEESYESTSSLPEDEKYIDLKDQILYEENDVRVIGDHVSVANDGDIMLAVDVESQSKNSLRIRTKELSINGTDFSPEIFSGFLLGALPSEGENYLTTKINASTLRDAGAITEEQDAEEICFKLAFCDDNTLEELFVSDDITIHLNK